MKSNILMSIKKTLPLITSIISCLTLVSWSSNANDADLKINWVQPNVEELRVSAAEQSIPQVFKALSTRSQDFTKQIQQAKNLTTLNELVSHHGTGLWQDSVKSFNQLGLKTYRHIYLRHTCLL